MHRGWKSPANGPADQSAAWCDDVATPFLAATALPQLFMVRRLVPRPRVIQLLEAAVPAERAHDRIANGLDVAWSVPGRLGHECVRVWAGQLFVRGPGTMSPVNDSHTR
jgi:hypothetical protein